MRRVDGLVLERDECARLVSSLGVARRALASTGEHAAADDLARLAVACGVVAEEPMSAPAQIVSDARQPIAASLTIEQWATRHHVSQATARRRAAAGAIEGAHKHAGRWLLPCSPTSPTPDTLPSYAATRPRP